MKPSASSSLLVAAILMLTNIRYSASSNSIVSSMHSDPDFEGKCELITIPMCLTVGYNYTRMPNELNHDTQEEAGMEVHQFWPLVEIKCSPDLLFFLCSMYTPICLKDYAKRLPPCRGLCRRAREGCEPIMQQYGFKWPDRMECEQFPEFGLSDNLCMDENKENSPQTTQKSTTPRSKHKPRCKDPKNCPVTPGEKKPNDCTCHCKAPLIPLGKDSILYNRSVAAGSVPNCAHPCQETFFNADEKEFAAVWITLWSALCAASTLMTLTTFLIETERFKYPERPIVFLSACYFLVSVGYLIRVGVGHSEVACDGNIIRYSSTGPNMCTLVFLLVYFFGMASSIWWVVLSFTWFLAAGLKWGNEAIASYAQFFHLAAWLIPTIQTVSVLLSGAVDGDIVAGICHVGNMNMDNLKTFVLAPLFAYLLVGFSFLLAGFVSLFRIRSVIKKQGGTGAGVKADKLEKLMIRIGIFSVLYMVPATIVIGCYLYEHTYHDEWLSSLTCTCFNPVNNSKLRSKPLYSVLMLKYFMALAVGITSGVWIWSGKTLDSWRRLWRRLFGRPDMSGAGAVLIKTRPGKPPPQYLVAGPGSASLLAPTGSVASASQHHLHHHVLKQPPLSHV
ncbi:frizzled-2 [Onthophagus taurus]|uniref:frizzled-2 n=1 Tax=Onthophagus taurus TaxID=166361 RepID=UPI000C2033FA|nr:frizzled-2 [Onthophagus taurus]XP_022903649.1 frizzled-2 [Onthophagus taurus]XP_022903650.1 frizzled-2 [Onthophagus taurus]